MEPVVRYAAHEDLLRVNELRQQVSELHAAGRPDIFRPGFCEALQQHVYQLFDAPEFDVLVACVGETICGFAAVLSSFLPEPWNGLAANGCVVLFLRLHAKHKAEPDGGTPERNVDEAYDNTTEAGSSVSAYTYSGALGVPYAFAR